MIIDLPETTTNAVNKRLVKLRDEGGAVALGRVLTLVVLADEADVEDAVAAANGASREHPCRIVVVAPSVQRTQPRLDAQIRIGGDAGASEVVVLRPSGPLAAHSDTLVMPLLLPDAPIVAWWPRELPDDPSRDPVGQMAHRRITDTVGCADPVARLASLSSTHSPGDTDLAWTRVTLWRGLIAAALDEPPYESVTAVEVEGQEDHPSVDLLAGWLALQLRCPVTLTRRSGVSGVTRVVLGRKGGSIVLDRPDGRVVTISQPDQPDRRISLPMRQLEECLTEELRRLDPDEVFGDVLTKGLTRVSS
ncbi:glucose-6-phosphate dehydrogenase assembly protein OpcA [Oerskovia flava]|uniref:glucose-6-phosphate dehydrogenase assembly protein OpcA n=1 Tax=Oerskovia flava TaxID=2986422 RepID=UPI0022404DB2|nr:glucose-6-phosphate dehydrogenase assembly protein OpcA [Oerskovia sp. JB1-3-2]